ncbi:MAG: hypothetical protein ACYDEJ_03555 [Desulfitobacteriaceae bacterium]
MVKNGKILAFGPPEEILSEEMVADLYGIDSANFSNCLGGVELRNSGGARCFVLAGAGTGTPIYRLLNKHGFSIVTGVIHENDIDYYVGKAIGATVISEKPFEEINKSSINRAISSSAQAECIIDAGFPAGTLNKLNVDLARRLLAQNKIIYSLRNPEEARKLFGVDDGKLIYCPTTVALMEKLKRREANKIEVQTSSKAVCNA